MGKTILTPTQHKFLESIKKFPEITRWFYFTGGTALAEFYLHHRLSEDIDLFSTSQVNDQKIDYYLKELTPKLLVKSITKDHISGLFVYKLKFSNGDELKVDFNEYPHEVVEQSNLHIGDLKVDSFYDIAINKAYTITGRFKVRDFIDLYFILKKDEFSLEQLLNRISDKFGVNVDQIYFASQLLRASDLTKDIPKMLVPFDFDEMVEFYKKQAKRLGSKVLR